MELITKEFRNKKGFAEFSICEISRIAKIEIIVIYPDYRNSGQGSKFLKRIIDFVESFDADIEKIILTAASFHNDRDEQNAIPQDRLVQFYESYGFVKVSTNAPFVVPMEKIL